MAKRAGYIVSSRGKKTLPSYNFYIGGKRTSTRLSPTLVKAIHEIARREHCETDQLYSHIDRTKEKGVSLANGIRDFVVRYFREAATEAGHRRAGHGKLLWKR